nr:retrotransposon protein, putative, Ty1-copia subclass [Tanacetum cinerariifolium]
MTTSSANNSVFRGFFEKQKPTGPNFIDWYRQLRIVLSIEDKLNYLEQPIPPAPVVPAGQHVVPEILAAHNAWIKGSKEIAGLMLMTMKPEIQRNLEPLHAHQMLRELKTLFAQGQNRRKGKNKQAYAPKHKIPSPPKREDPEKDSICHECVRSIEKLQHDGLLDSSDLRAFEKCVSCMSGNMARKPYTHQVEMAKDLLGLIHTDVCGPFKIMSRQGASYFVTFTDDFSQNQLGKTIKLLRFDRVGEYMSQEFLDHLKDHGIIAHRTPPYTPQHNDVSERRNRTLLDMVRSMMSETTLPKFF